MSLRTYYSSAARATLLALAVLMVGVTALPLLRLDHWWIRILDFPRVQISLAGLAIAALYLCFWSRPRVHEYIVYGLLLLALGYQAVKIFPYTVLMPKQVQTVDSPSDDTRLSLLVANVLIDNRSLEAFLDVVRQYDPTIILTIEPDEWWEEALRVLEEAYPHTLKKPLDNTYGMIVHSRLELIDPEVRFILKDDIPSMHMQVELPAGHRVYMHFVHPDPPNPYYATETTERDAELLIVGKEVAERDKPTIIAGDFNDVPWSRTTSLFQSTSGLLDPRVGRGMYNTFNAKNPLLRWPLEYVFHSNHFKLVRIETGPAWGSDHFPLFVELSLEPEAEAEQEETDTNLAEDEQADEKIRDGEQRENP